MNAEHSPWLLRPAHNSDLAALLALENNCFSADRLSRRSFRHYLQSSNAEMVVADAEG
ncbi:MAG TPA: ribosomal-protein-alanine acetyltransferase, partial [Alteromonas sp.]|nr:ribosomal-protein-alanine acetyltransferase [Alteromonas sp.]